MGGAGYPTADKILAALRDGLRVLLVNAVECEPGIESDAWLLTHHSGAVGQSIEWLQRALGGVECIVCQSESTPPLEFGNARIAVQPVPSQTPNGEERHLVQRSLDIDIGRDQRPSEHGVLVLNVGTVYAIGQALQGKPLTQRVVTLPGGARWVDLGTPLQALFAAPQYRVGGHLTGRIVSGEHVVDQTTNAVWPAQARLAQPCINCARCDAACPAELPVAALIRPQLHSERAAAMGLDACFDCGLCTPVCPSDINVLAELRRAKTQLTAMRHAAAQAEDMRQRSAAHEARVAEQAKASADRRSARLAARLAGRGQRQW